MKCLLILALLCTCAFGQANGNRPNLIQSYTTSIANNCGSSCTVSYIDNVSSGNVLFIAQANNPNNFSPTDSLGTSFSASGVFSNTDGSGTSYISMYCGVAPSSGADTITGTAGPFTALVVIAEFSGVGTCSTDGTNTVTSPPTVSTTSMTIQPVTTNSGDFCVSFGSTWWATENMFSNGGNTAGGDGALKGINLDYRMVGASGTQSIVYSLNTQLYLAGLAWVARSQCYTPTALTIDTTALPAGATGVAYPAQMTYSGGSGSTRTWSISAGSPPTGISMNSSGTFSGTPSGSGTSTFTVQVTDGTHTTSQQFSIVIGASLATPAIVGHATFAVGPITYSAAGGNLLLVGFWGNEISGSYIWTSKYNGTNSSLQSSPPLSFTRVYPLPGVGGTSSFSNGSPMSIYAACVPQTSAYTINFVASGAGAVDAVEVSGAQGNVLDDAFIANTAGFASSPGTETVNATAQVGNTMAVLFGNNATSVNSPFTLIDAGSTGTLLLLSAYDLVSSAGSFSGTVNSTCSAGANCNNLPLATEIVPLRPNIAGASCGPVNPIPLSEKFRRHPF